MVGHSIFKLHYFCIGHPDICRIEQNIDVLNKKNKIINDCLFDGREELLKLKKKQNKSTGNSENIALSVASFVVLFPWWFASAICDENKILKKEEEIQSMVSAQKEIQRIIELLQEIIHAYT